MDAIYLGIDVAGAKNTWVAGLCPRDGRLHIAVEPHLSSLAGIVALCQERPVVAAAIDAQLTMSLCAETGFRASDLHLRECLPPDCWNWVSSINSLMAVPVRSRLLADHLAPLVGTLLETHPRASLLFGLGEPAAAAVRNYKRRGTSNPDTVATLWERWAARFGISFDALPESDGPLDALVCATVAYLYHHAPPSLFHLREESPVRGADPSTSSPHARRRDDGRPPPPRLPRSPAPLHPCSPAPDAAERLAPQVPDFRLSMNVNDGTIGSTPSR